MLSFYLFCGLVAGGAVLALGQLARAVRRDRDTDADVRGLAVLMAALAEGLGVIALVVGLLTAFLPDDTGGMAAVALVIVPALVLGLPALRLFGLRDLPAGLAGSRSLVILLAAFAVGLAFILAVVALMALLLEEGAGADGFDPIVILLGVVGAIAAAAIGLVGAGGMTALASDGGAGAAPLDVEEVRRQTITRAAIAEVVGILACVGALYLLVFEG